MTEPIAHLAVPAKDLKKLREALSVSQTLIGAYSFVPKYIQDLNRMIREIDRHRPLGSNGKHGNLHTATCGCEDK